MEDEPDIIEIMGEICKAEGFEIVTAQNGREALEKLNEGLVPNLVLLDLMMPEMSGQNFLKEFRKLPEPVSKVAVVVVSADAQTQKVAFEIGAEAHLKKPFTIQDFSDILAIYSK